MVHRCIYTISSDKASPRRLMNSLHWKAHMSVGTRRRAHLAMAALSSHGGGRHVNLCPHIDVRP
jgi:hypothetical protein